MVEEAEWLITSSSKEEYLRSVVSIANIFPKSKHTPFIYPELENPNIDRGQILIKSVQQSVDICLQDSSPMLMATPDFIYGNGTIGTFAKVADEPGSCATIANIRVLPSILRCLSDGEFYIGKNSDLVMDAFSCLHKSWSESPKNLYHSGVKVKELPGRMWAVEHFMPSPFYVNFLECDKQPFKEWHERKPPGFGLWDHVWPTYLLEQGRLRYIGSSDAAVMLEVTDHDMNVPPLNKPENPQDKFFRNHFHNNIQRQFVSIFRT